MYNWSDLAQMGLCFVKSVAFGIILAYFFSLGDMGRLRWKTEAKH